MCFICKNGLKSLLWEELKELKFDEARSGEKERQAQARRPSPNPRSSEVVANINPNMFLT